MKVFISWSGTRSQALGQALWNWLPLVLHYVEPWLSQTDISAGDRWAIEVAKELEASNFGIICITKDNLNSSWILFEAGALAKFMQEGRVIPLLLDIDFKDVSGPLAQFQAKKVEREGVRDVVEAVNRLSGTAVPDARLTQLFTSLWSDLETRIAAIPKQTLPVKQNRPQHEVLEELVAGVRGLELRLREGSDRPVRFMPRRRHRMHPGLLSHLARMLGEEHRRSVLVLLVASMFRDDIPWLYELGMESYRQSMRSGPARGGATQLRFFRAIGVLTGNPSMLEDMGLDSRYYHSLLRDAAHALDLESPTLDITEAEEDDEAADSSST